MMRWVNQASSFLYTLIFCITYAYIYMYIISPSWFYMGFIFIPENVIFLTFAIPFVSFISFFMPKSYDKPSYILIYMIYYFNIIPIFISGFLLSEEPIDSFLNFLFPILLCFLLFILILKSKSYRIKIFKIPSNIFWLLFLIFAVFLQIFLIFNFNLNFNTDIFSPSIYEQRLEMRSSLQGITGYLVQWNANVFSAILFAWGLTERKIFFLILGITGQMLNFGIDASKSALFSPLISLAFYLILSSKNKISISFLKYIMILFLLCLFYYVVFNSDALISLFVRRFFATPSIVANFYYDFFRDNDKFYLSHSIFSSFLKNPYDIDPAFLIGRNYMANELTSANASFFADGYANFGILGIFLFSFIMANVLKFYDCVVRERGFDVILAGVLVSVPSIAILNSAMITTLVTHGLLLLIFLSMYIPLPIKRRDFKNLKTLERSSNA